MATAPLFKPVQPLRTRDWLPVWRCEARAKLHRFQHLPFGGGPRVCVGARFATMEALLILARWLSVRRFSMPPGWQPDPVGAVTLRPRGEMILQAELL